MNPTRPKPLPYEEFERNPMRRTDNEHPEHAYRRGYQQGAYAVVQALRLAGVLDPETLERLEQFAGVELFKWRYSKRALQRTVVEDAPPDFEF